MKTIKTRKQSILFKIFEEAGACYFAVAAIHFFAFDRPGLLPETDLWKFIPAELGADALFDMGLPKPRGEVIITGRCYAPAGKPIRAASVSFRLGGLRKTIDVLGDRYWKKDLAGAEITEPEPFTVMDISYANAFGGPGFDRNPRGKGFEKITQPDGKEIQPLPNIEDPDRLITSPQEKPDPVGFGPIDMTWPQRMSKAGTYDEAWLADRFPGYAADMDPTFFNMAPPDQWIKGFFTGNESFEFYKMHPEEAVLSGTLPGFRSRVFINRRTDDDDVLYEIKTHPETAWFFPHAKRGIVIHRGVTTIGTDDGDDVLHLMAAYESLAEEPLPFEHYRQEFERRSDEEKGFLLALQDRGLTPLSEVAAQAGEDEAEKQLYAGDGVLAENMKKRAEKERSKAEEAVRSMGLDPAVIMPPPQPEQPEIDPNTMDPDKIIRLIEDAKTDALAQKEAAEKKLRDLCKTSGLDYETVMERARAQAARRPAFSADKTIETLKQLGMDDPAMIDKLKLAQEQVDASYKKFAHQFPAPAPLSRDEADRLKERFRAMHAAGESLAGKDFAGIDCSGMDLRGINLTNALLEGADFSGADLSDADLSGAVLAWAAMAGATMNGTRLKGTCLGGTDLTGATLTNADLSDGILGKSNLTKADLSGAIMENVDLMEAQFKQTNLSNVTLVQAILIDADLTGVLFAGANLSESIFIKPKLDGADFTGVKASGTIFVDASCERAIFKDADFTNARFPQNARLAGADFSGAVLDEANLMEADLTGAVFVNASLNKANLMKANLTNADFTGATAQQANCIKGNFTGAIMTGANLMEANLMKARLDGTDMRMANLYGAEVLKAELGKPDFEGANLKMTKIADWSADDAG